MDIVWDEVKNEINIHKHGVSLVEASTVLHDQNAIRRDNNHPTKQRFEVIGMSAAMNILFVVYEYSDTQIRVMHAKKAKPWQRRVYAGK